MAPKPVLVATAPTLPESYEQEHVHAVYDKIASHFSSTRYKPWPVVAAFINSLPTGWVGLDSGTGNGKYIALQPEDSTSSGVSLSTYPGRRIWTIGLDRSINLLKIAKHAGALSGHGVSGNVNEVVQGDALDLCWRGGVFDYAISIATIHHLATAERRRHAVKTILRSLSPTHGRALIYVWATRQDEASKRTMPATEDAKEHGRGQDVFVPWELNEQLGQRESERMRSTDSDRRVFNRYYHMFDEGELRELVSEAAEELGLILSPVSNTDQRSGVRYIDIVQDGWEKSNFYVELRLFVG